MSYSIDLHTHSSMSDGILNPEDLVSRAKLHGVEVLSLTDHDTVAGIAVAQATADRVGIKFIPGIELSAEWNGAGVHIVGLGVDIKSPILLNAIKSQSLVRERRAETIAARLEKQGIKGALDGARAQAGEAAVARPHFAAYLIEAGYVRTMNDAFKRYLGNGTSGDVKQIWPNIEQVIGWINDSGGMAVLAHPAHYTMTNTKLRKLVGDFCAHGGGAIEVISGRQTDDVTQRLAKLATEFGLYASAGSDFHNPEYPWQSLGGFGTLPPTCTPVPLF